MTDPTETGHDDYPVDDDLDVETELDALGLTEAELDYLLDSDRPIPNLTNLLEPDDNMVGRVTHRVEDRIADREALATIADLVGLGWFTLQAVLGSHNEP